MQFGSAVGTACSSFAITNIDDIFVLVTFFAEASTNKNFTPLKITLGQYAGFTVIMVISMIGFGAALLIPSEPIGFLGLLPIYLGIWKVFELLPNQEEEEEAEITKYAGFKTIFQVGAVTIMNGGDNIGTYIPLFSQAKGAEIAVYVVVYYILLGVWCLAAYLILREKHILRLMQKCVHYLISPLYVGLGIFIVIKSDCYPWSIEHINDSTSSNLGKLIIAVVTTVALLACIGVMAWFKLFKKKPQPAIDAETPSTETTSTHKAVATIETCEPTDDQEQSKEKEVEEAAKNGEASTSENITKT